MALEMTELAKRLPTMAFSKIGGAANLGDEEGLAFMQGLFRAAVLSKDDGDWSRVEEFLEEWETKLISRSGRNALRYEDTPWRAFGKRVSEARVALIGTGGVYMAGGVQEAFDTDGDASFRPIPSSTPASELGIAHTHYDTSGAEADANVVFPIDRLREMEADGAIGSLAETAYGFMGYIVGEHVRTLIEETAPEVGRRLAAAGVEAALIGTT